MKVAVIHNLRHRSGDLRELFLLRAIRVFDRFVPVQLVLVSGELTVGNGAAEPDFLETLRASEKRFERKVPVLYLARPASVELPELPAEIETDRGRETPAALLERIREAAGRGQLCLSPMQQAVRYIEEHYMQDLSLNALAEELADLGGHFLRGRSVDRSAEDLYLHDGQGLVVLPPKPHAAVVLQGDHQPVLGLFRQAGDDLPQLALDGLGGIIGDGHVCFDLDTGHGKTSFSLRGDSRSPELFTMFFS